MIGGNKHYTEGIYAVEKYGLLCHISSCRVWEVKLGQSFRFAFARYCLKSIRRKNDSIDVSQNKKSTGDNKDETLFARVLNVDTAAAGKPTASSLTKVTTASIR